MSQTASIPDQLPSKALEAWSTCSARLTTLGVPKDKVDIILKKSFGWAGQGFWRGEIENVTPAVEKIDKVLNFFATELGISSEADQAKLIATFPEVLGLSIDLMKDNIEKLKFRFFLNGPALTASIKRKPRVLGSVVDCEGSCEGWCTRCFVQF
jgi:hypothetical protein